MNDEPPAEDQELANRLMREMPELARHAGSALNPEEECVPFPMGKDEGGETWGIMCRPSGDVWTLKDGAAWRAPYPPGSAVECYREGELVARAQPNTTSQN